MSLDILANGQISHAADYRPLIVGYKNGAAVRLSDVAEVDDSVQNLRTAGYLNGERAVTVIIFASLAPISSRPTMQLWLRSHSSRPRSPPVSTPR